MAHLTEPPRDMWPIYVTNSSPDAIDFLDHDIADTAGTGTPRMIRIATDGNMSIVMASGKTRFIPAGTFTVGVWHKLQFKKVLTTFEGKTTTADGIWAGID